MSDSCDTITDYGSMHVFFNTLCKEFYTCTCKM